MEISMLLLAIFFLGSVVSFRLILAGLEDSLSGQWFTSNGSVISVDRLSGLAEAFGEGSAEVSFQYGSLKLHTTVKVLKGDVINVDAPKEILTNVPYPSKGYNFSVKLRDTHGKFSGASIASHGVSFDCRVDPPFVGHTKPWLDLGTGHSYCLFFPYKPENLVHLAPRLKGMRPDISLSIHASLKGANHASGSALAHFIGGFSIMEMGESSMRLNLTPECNKTIITILGNTDVEIHWRYTDLIVINLVDKEDFGIGGSAQYEIKLRIAKKFEDKISITLPATGQRVEIDVNYEPEEKAPSLTIIDAATWALILGMSLLFLFWVLKDTPRRPQQSGVAAPTSSSLAPSTPVRSSNSVVNDASPRTPQPFVDYVRRTIDETPYYRRTGRRVNPQNTY